MMKAYAFIYSRTRYDRTGDYRILSGVSESICPEKVMSSLAMKSLSLTNAKDDELRIPQWLFVIEKGFALWGLAGLNDILNQNFGKDDQRRPLRNFTGIVVPDYDGQELPNDIRFFSVLFSSVMERLFESFAVSCVSDFIVDTSTASSFIYPQPFDSRPNKDYHQCRIFSPTVDAESLVASCLSYPDDISIAINVAHIESVTTPRFNPLMNAVMRDAMPEEITDIPVKHLCGNCGKAVDDLYDGLCRECWDEQHPRCSRCGKETSELYGGLCQECWNELHPRCKNCGIETSDLYDGLCETCYMQHHPHCKKCNTEFDDPTALSSRGLCKKCERKRRLWLWVGIVMVLSLLVISIVHYVREYSPINSYWPVIEKNGFFNPANTSNKEQPKQQEKHQIEHHCQAPQREELKDIQPNGHGGKSNTQLNTPEQDTQKQIKDSVPNKLVFI